MGWGGPYFMVLGWSHLRTDQSLKLKHEVVSLHGISRTLRADWGFHVSHQGARLWRQSAQITCVPMGTNPYGCEYMSNFVPWVKYRRYRKLIPTPAKPINSLTFLKCGPLLVLKLLIHKTKAPQLTRFMLSFILYYITMCDLWYGQYLV